MLTRDNIPPLFKDAVGFQWAIVDHSDAHGLCFLGLCVRTPSGGRLPDPRRFAWFNPAGTPIRDHRIAGDLPPPLVFG